MQVQQFNTGNTFCHYFERSELEGKYSLIVSVCACMSSVWGMFVCMLYVVTIGLGLGCGCLFMLHAWAV